MRRHQSACTLVKAGGADTAIAGKRSTGAMTTNYLQQRGKVMNSKRVLAGVSMLLVLAALAACGGGGGGSAPATAITAQPSDQSVVAGTTATFTVVASNATGFQWQRSTGGGTSFTDIAGASAASHTTAVTTLADTGSQYRVTVTGTGTVTSSAVTLTVTPVIVAPGISTQPVAQSVTAGQDASFSVTATGSSLGYQWQRSTDGGANFADLAGATQATLTRTAVPLADNADQFRVVVNNSAGSVTSNAAILTVNAAQSAPAFTAQPASVSVLTPNTATFTVVVTGNPGPTLQWQRSINSGGSFADIAGATGSSYTSAATVAGDNGNQYRVIASNTVGNATSNAATLTVALPAAPSFTAQPSSITVNQGQNASFTVAASGTPTPALQWQLSTDGGASWGNINGATSASLYLSNVAASDNGRRYRAVASNSVGSVNSSAAVLTVLPKTWGAKMQVETGVAGDSSSQQIAVDASGNAIAVWMQQYTDASNGVHFDIWANRYTMGTGWGTPELLETGTGFAMLPQIAMSANGNAMAVWKQYSSASNSDTILARRYTAGAGWSGAETISSGSGSATDPQIAVDANGNALAVWSQQDGAYYSIYANSYRNGLWGTAVTIETDNNGNATRPQVAFDANGNALAVWAQSNGVVTHVWANRYATSIFVVGSWATARMIETVNSGNAEIPQLAVDPNGNAMAIWLKWDGTRYNLWANRFTVPSLDWGTATLIEHEDLGHAGNASIAVDASGNAMAVWAQHNGTISNIWVDRYTAGTGWASAELLETNNTYADFPRVAVDASGNAMAVWNQYRSHYFNRYVPGTGWSTAALVIAGSIYTNEPTQAARFAFDASGNALAVWPEFDGTTYNIVGSRFE